MLRMLKDIQRCPDCWKYSSTVAGLWIYKRFWLTALLAAILMTCLRTASVHRVWATLLQSRCVAAVTLASQRLSQSPLCNSSEGSGSEYRFLRQCNCDSQGVAHYGSNR